MLSVLADNYKRKKYNVAIYCRLSNDDGEVGESNSIGNQKSILTKYVMDQGWDVVDFYVDDGYSGLQFDRPGFERMLKDINDGKISLVITKDMSRLGRDYIQVGHYIERFFPEKKVRFIAVNDNIDTEKDLGNNDIAPFKAIINDMYSKDISKKVRSVFDLKRREGKFIGPFAPYGYQKDESDNNKLVIDSEASIVVLRMFKLYLKGLGLTAIARQLNSESILCPAAYKNKTTGTYNNGKMKVVKWCHGSVKSILKNPTYTGNMVQNKYKKVNYKSKKGLKLGKADWIVVEDTHEPIISVEEFEQVQQLMNGKNDKYTIARKEAKLFSGLTFCGDCGNFMTYYKTKAENYYLICSGYKRYGKDHCSRHSILEEKLETMILQNIHQMFDKYVDKEKVQKEAKRLISSKKDIHKIYADEMNIIDRKMNEIQTVLLSLYQDKVKGIIDEDQFVGFNKELNTERMNLANRHSQLQSKLMGDQKAKTEEEKVRKLVESALNLNKLNKVIINQLIEKIDIHEDEDITIKYKFKNPF